MISKAITLMVLAALGAPLALRAGEETPTSVTGTITCRESRELPPDAVVHVWLETESARHEPARRAAETKFSAARKKFPIAYTLPYRASELEPGGRYQLRAVISSGSRVLYLARHAVPAAMDGAPPRVEIAVEPFATGARPQVTALSPRLGLSGEWRLTALPGAGTPIAAGDKAPTLVIASAEKRISGSTGCNQFFGACVPGKDNSFSLDPSGSTQMACPGAPGALETAYLAALRGTTAYRISGATLELLAGERVLARFERRRPQAASD